MQFVIDCFAQLVHNTSRNTFVAGFCNGMAMNEAERQARQAFEQHGGVLRMSDALRAGVHRRTLYAMRDSGQIEVLARGLYRLSDAQPLGHPDLVTVCAKIPRAVVCLVSALAFHDLTTQIPHEVWIAIPRNSEPPRLEYPPVRIFRMGATAYEAGIETHTLDGVPIKMYCREKTLADCFKYRSEVGMDSVLEAVRRYKVQGKVNADELLRYASICRVAQVARPYLEAVL